MRGFHGWLRKNKNNGIDDSGGSSTVAELKNGEKGRVASVNGGCSINGKLESLGLRPGVEVVKKSSVLGHGPVILQIGMTQVAIGHHMARKILIEKE